LAFISAYAIFPVPVIDTWESSTRESTTTLSASSIVDSFAVSAT